MSRPLARAACALAVAAPLLLAAAPAHAAALGARLVLPGGEPARGWLVSVVGQAATVPCDAQGAFRLDPAPAPPFWVIASGPDGEVSAPLEITTLGDGELVLELPPVVRDSVTIVTGVAPTLDTSPANATTVVSREELEQRAPQRLYQVMESVAGAGKLGEGADSVPAIRGLSRGRTLILLDGARVSAERRAGPSGTFIDPESLGSVEVLRGPGSVVYGSDAFGGVINAVTRDPEAERWGLRFGLEGGLAALDQWGAYVAAFGRVGPGSLLVDGHWRSADDAEAGEGVAIFNSGLDALGGGVRWVQDLGPGRLRVSAAADRVEDLGKAAIDSRQIRAFYPEEESRRLVASWLGSPGGGWESLEGLVAWDDYHVVLDRDRAPTATTSRRVDRAETDARDAAVRAVATRPVAGGRLRLGFDTYSRFAVHATTGRVDYAADAATVTRVTSAVSIEDASQLTSGLFATWSRPLAAKLSLDLGLRGDAVETENRGGFFGDRSQSHTALSGSLSLSWSVAPGWTTTAQVARGFRSPTLSDRYFRGPSGRGFVTGNPELDPERSLQLDVSTRWTHDRSSLALYAYRYAIDQLIERYGAGADFFFRNRGEATLEGFEVEAQTAIGERWSGDLGLAWADGETDGGAEIDDVAAPNGWLTVRWAVGKGYVLGRVTRFLAHDQPGPTELARAGYTLWDLGAGWRFGDDYELRAIVRNLADELYFGAADNAADRSPGRSVTLALSGRV